MAEQDNLKAKCIKLFWMGKVKSLGPLVDDSRQQPSLNSLSGKAGKRFSLYGAVDFTRKAKEVFWKWSIGNH